MASFVHDIRATIGTSRYEGTNEAVGAWIHFAVGIVYMSLLVSLLFRRFERSLAR